jgi:hypothetical protein
VKQKDLKAEAFHVSSSLNGTQNPSDPAWWPAVQLIPTRGTKDRIEVSAEGKKRKERRKGKERGGDEERGEKRERNQASTARAETSGQPV